MSDERNATPRARRNGAATAAQHEVAAAAPVHEQYALLCAGQACAESIDERRAEDAPVAALEFFGQVDDLHGGQLHSRRSSREPDVRDAAITSAGVRVERRSRATENERAAGEPHPFSRDGDCVVARHAVLFVRALVRFVDDDEADVRQRREDGAARTDDDVDFTARSRCAAFKAFALGEPRVQYRDPFAECRFKAPRRLRRQSDFRYEHDRATTALERPRDRADVDERLTAARDALHQHFAEDAACGARIDRFDRPQLLVRRRELVLFAPPPRA